MRVLIFSILSLLLFLPHISARAKVPPDILEAYKAYQVEMKSGHLKDATKYAKLAWQRAEKELGDDVTTGRLALNYGRLLANAHEFKKAIPLLTRSADLAHLETEAPVQERLSRELELAIVYFAAGEKGKAAPRLREARQFAQEHGLDESVVAGEIRIFQARLKADSANHRHFRGSIIATQARSAKLAQEALDIFNKHPDEVSDTYMATAYKLVGFSHERKKHWLEAALAYQKAMLILKKSMGFEDKPFITTVGRWANARTHVLGKMSREEAESRGICRCWPYDGKKIKRLAKPVKRVPPRMPKTAFTSGFSFVKFDLDDEGKPINIKVLHSWPKDIFDKSSIRSVKKWRYTPRQDGETDEMRKGIVTQITYILTDYFGGDPI